jgi:hypothetical protein
MLFRALVASSLAALLVPFAACEGGSSPESGDAGEPGADAGGGGVDAPATGNDADSEAAPTTGPIPGGDCATILCAQGTECVYRGEGALCGARCTTNGTSCGGGLTCKCGGSCPMCKDCVLVCAP